MKKAGFFLISIVLLSIISFNNLFITYADEKENKVTITINEDYSGDSSAIESDEKQDNDDTQSEGIEKKHNLPQTNDNNNFNYSVIGGIFFLIAIVGIIYKKRNGELYNEKN